MGERQRRSVRFRTRRRLWFRSRAESSSCPGGTMRAVVNKLTPAFLKPYIPINQLPQMSKTVGLGSWSAVGGVFAFFLVQDPAFQFVKDTISPPPPEEDK